MSFFYVLAAVMAAATALLGWAAWRLTKLSARQTRTGPRVVLILCAAAAGTAALGCGLVALLAGSCAGTRFAG